jgi:hypothetical protein
VQAKFELRSLIETFFVNPSTLDNVFRIVLRAAWPGFAAKTKKVAERVRARGVSMNCCRPPLLMLVVIVLEGTRFGNKTTSFDLSVLASQHFKRMPMGRLGQESEGVLERRHRERKW